MPYLEGTSGGGMAGFNVNHGFIEGIVRGFRSGFLTDTDYNNLGQCETLEEVKLNLQETDYGSLLSNIGKINPAAIHDMATRKYVCEFNYLCGQAQKPLSSFLRYMQYEYMIDNIMLLLKGTLSGRNIEELIGQCHPLGLFDNSTMKLIPLFEASPKGYQDLYQTVLIDTPVGPYFSQFLEEHYAGCSDDGENLSMMRNVLEEVEVEIIKNSLVKLWLQDFYRYCEGIGGDTGTIMCELLAARADRHSINITLNSFGGPLNDPQMRGSDRHRLYPAIGTLYPECTSKFIDVADNVQLSAALEPYPTYREIWAIHTSGSYNDKSIDDAFFERDAEMLELAFEGQMHFACFYAYLKLKEQEVRNLVWISECIIQNQRDEIGKYVPLFSENSPWRLARRRN